MNRSKYYVFANKDLTHIAKLFLTYPNFCQLISGRVRQKNGDCGNYFRKLWIINTDDCVSPQGLVAPLACCEP